MSFNNIMALVFTSFGGILLIIIFIKILFGGSKSYDNYMNKPIGETLSITVTASNKNGEVVYSVTSTKGASQEMIDKRCVDVLEIMNIDKFNGVK